MLQNIEEFGEQDQECSQEWMVNIEKFGEQDQECSQEWMVNTNPDYQHFLLPQCLLATSVVHRTWEQVSCWFDPQVWPILFLRIDDSHCDKIDFSLTAVYFFGNGYVGKQLVAYKEYCAEY